MKKIFFSITASLFLIGCVSTTNVNVENKIKQVNLDNMLMKKYQITSDNLIKFNNGYIFYSPSSKGTDIVFLDRNYNKIKTVSTPILLNTKKLAVNKNRIYLLGVNENSYNPALIIIDSNGKVLKIDEINKKYAIPKDMLIDKNNIYFIIDVYKNGKSFVEIYKNGKFYKKIEFKNSINGDFLLKNDNDLILIGTIKNTTQDAFVMDLKKGWIRFFDLGMDEEIQNPKIQNDKIIFTLHSTDNMGADEYYEIIVDENGKIIQNKTKVKFAPIPMKFRT